MQTVKWTVLVCLAVSALIGGAVVALGEDDVDVVQRRLDLVYDEIDDTDDMCVWIHPTDPSLSTIIAADKAADFVVVYDLAGNVIQKLPLARNDAGSEQAGNIDIRYGFMLGDKTVDVVALNQRARSQGYGMRIYTVDPESRTLERVDDGRPMEHANYGMCLYKSSVSGKLYYFATAKSQGVVQYELVDNGHGQITPIFMRQWDQRKCEGAVADDELGYVYICEESSGVWRYEAEPDGSTEGTLIAATGENGFKKDAEGVTIYYAPDGGGYLIASSQGNDRFIVYERCRMTSSKRSTSRGSRRPTAST